MVKKSRTIEIDLEIYRLIETNRSSFDETETDILRRLLNLPHLEKPRAIGKGLNLGYSVILPDGTLLKGRTRRPEVQAEVRDGWIIVDGERFDSPSGAAKKFGGPNGWIFWKVKRPQDSEWILLDQLRNRETIIRKRLLSEEELAEFD
ncbi:MAG: hypothetical protein KKD99_11010 [Proteobacteria bacterium]|nr:hypothetical protein [Pseudomonadota bacterium]MBU4353833.1 hypothetical protein [Pseudomonadota bacterium]MBU4449107.1 hypothetical protein [Pseudomonadota bacterium]MCG2773519.1 hypothetical protein [Desulfobacterales bacterium]